jgi:hypothetical protein
MQTALFAAVPREKTGRASSLWNTSRQVAIAFGTAVAATVLIAVLGSGNAGEGGLAGVSPGLGISAFHDTVAVLLVMSALAVFFAWQVQDRAPAAAEPRVAAPLQPALTGREQNTAAD